MTTDRIHYCAGYKYQLRRTYACQTSILPDREIVTDLVRLCPDGRLWIGKYFAWDGCSGPAIDDKTNMRACMIHDALYYLIRIGLLDTAWRMDADRELFLAMIEDGAHRLRATTYEWAVNYFAARCADPANARAILVAP